MIRGLLIPMLLGLAALLMVWLILVTPPAEHRPSCTRGGAANLFTDCIPKDFP